MKFLFVVCLALYVRSDHGSSTTGPTGYPIRQSGAPIELRRLEADLPLMLDFTWTVIFVCKTQIYAKGESLRKLPSSCVFLL